ncbi:unnamed protein product [Auanema sp. JU1783]|nr:unnamed protein product [Auanema sp. JU1783]
MSEQSLPPKSNFNDLNDNDDKVLYRAVPLSTRNIFLIILFLSFFSFVYLGYAQHHKLMFYFMTSLIAVWISFIYTSGVLSVLYMVWYDYEATESSHTESGEEESSM